VTSASEIRKLRRIAQRTGNGDRLKRADHAENHAEQAEQRLQRRYYAERIRALVMARKVARNHVTTYFRNLNHRRLAVAGDERDDTGERAGICFAEFFQLVEFAFAPEFARFVGQSIGRKVFATQPEQSLEDKARTENRQADLHERRRPALLQTVAPANGVSRVGGGSGVALGFSQRTGGQKCGEGEQHSETGFHAEVLPVPKLRGKQAGVQSNHGIVHGKSGPLSPAVI
jgi:hypothetical protein